MEAKINAFVMYLHDVKKMSKNTEVSYKRDLTKLRIFLQDQGITQIEQVTKETIKEYIGYLEENKFSPSTVSRTIAAVKCWFFFMRDTYQIDANPVDGLKPPKIEKKAPDILSIKEIQTLLDQTKGSKPKEMRDQAMLLLLYTTGMRVSQLVSLKMSDMEEDTLCCGSGATRRKILLEKDAKCAVQEYLESARNTLLAGEDSEYIFVNCTGKVMSRQGFWKVLKSYVVKAGITKDITPHTLRHTMAVHAIEKGMDPEEIKELLGNTDISSMQVYIDICEAREQR